MARVALIALALAMCIALVAAYPQRPVAEEEPEDGPAYAEEDQGPPAEASRVERDSAYANPKGYGHSSSGKYQPVGPVRTFVKTDYHGNFKWGVRHVAGKGGYHRR